MTTRLVVYDMDGTLIDTPMPDTGKEIWKQKTGQEYPHVGWWGRAESLSLDVFDIKAFPEVLAKLNNDMTRGDTYTVILTSRLEKLRNEVEAILDKNQITVDDVLLKKGNMEKEERVQHLIKKFPYLTDVELYDDRDKEFKAFRSFKNNNPNLNVTIYKANRGSISLLEQLESEKILNIITKEVNKLNL
jgi:FMN phosphatase YigB (HAD superfamily)